MQNPKKIITSILSVALAGITSLSLVGCFDGDDEEKALSAYEIACKYGEYESEQDWLASLKGANGKDGKDLDITEMYEAARAGGYPGNLTDFISSYISVDVVLREDNDTKTIAQNTASVVSICAGFKKEVKIRGWNGITTETRVRKSEGSGVIVYMEENDTHASAYIITNYHVIYNTSNYTDSENGISQDIYIYPYGAREGFVTGDGTDDDDYMDEGGAMGDFTGDGIKATYVGGAMDYDIAVLKVTDSKYLKECAAQVATIGDSEEVTLGEKVYVIGNSNGEGISATGGMLSVESESIYMYSTDGLKRIVGYRVMRTDAAINPGNSGGGLFNLDGELIGITNAKNIEDTTDNMGYALPITPVKNLLQNIFDNDGCVRRANLGVITYLDSSISVMNDDGELDIYETFRISSVLTGDEVGAAGASTDENKCLKVGDIVQSIQINDGERCVFTRRHQFNDMLLTVRKGDVVKINVLRENTPTEITIAFDSDDYFIQYT